MLVPDAYTMRANSLQLNIGIIAACASFLKPLVGRLLKLNSTAGASYPSYPQYNRSHRTPLSNGYASGSRRTGDFELQYKSNIRALERHDSPSLSQLQATQAAAGGHSSPSADYYKHRPSDTDSDDILLQQPAGPVGIVRTREYMVKYSEA